jgi:uncharacterized membrane protein
MRMMRAHPASASLAGMAPPAIATVPRWSWAARFSRRQRLMGSLWFVPLICAIAGPALAEVAIALDSAVDPPASLGYSESTASTLLSAIVSAMVGLTGFIVAFGVLVVQMATQTLSPRFMRLWYRDVLQKAVLGAFVGTLTFALALLRAVSPQSVPDIGVSVAALAVTVSVVLFLVYLDRFVHNLRPVAVAWNVAAAGARVFESADWGPAGAALRPPAGEPSLVVCSGEAGIIQAIDRGGLLAAAARHDCLVVMPHAVGDLVPHGSRLLEVFGTGAPPAADRLRGMVALGEERTIEQDPAFAMRILVDIAIRALSPAVNDPTTAVQVLGALEDLLLLIGESDLSGRGAIRDATGTVRVIVETRRWEDLLALAMTEIRDYGATSTQVTRRTRALLEHLAVRVRPEHRPAVAEQLAALDDALGRAVPDPTAREFASRPDLQGIGGAPHVERDIVSS